MCRYHIRREFSYSKFFLFLRQHYNDKTQAQQCLILDQFKVIRSSYDLWPSIYNDLILSLLSHDVQQGYFVRHYVARICLDIYIYGRWLCDLVLAATMWSRCTQRIIRLGRKQIKVSLKRKWRVGTDPIQRGQHKWPRTCSYWWHTCKQETEGWVNMFQKIHS